MQRLRTTENRMQVSDDMNVYTFQAHDGYVDIEIDKSVINPTDYHRLRIEGRDNLRDCAEWLSSLTPVDLPHEPAAFVADGSDSKDVRHAAVASLPGLIASGMRYRADSGMTPEEARQDIDDNIGLDDDPSASLLGGWQAGDRVNNTVQAARNAGLIIPEGLVAVIFVKQTADDVSIRLGGPNQRDHIPVVAMHQFGDWMTANLSELQKKSIWS